MPDASPADAGGSRRLLPRSVWTLSWVSFFADASTETIYPLLPLFVVGVLGATRSELGLIEGAAVLTAAVTSALSGSRSDRAGRRVPWIRWGYGLPVAGKTLIALATAWPVLLCGRLLDRLGKGLRGPPRDALIADGVSSDRRGRAFGLHRAFDTAGAVTGVLLGALLLRSMVEGGSGAVAGSGLAAPQTPAWVFRAVFGAGAALGLVSFVLSWTVREAGPSIAGTPPSDDAAAAVASAAESGAVRRAGGPRRLLLAIGLFSLARSSETFLLLRASDLGHSSAVVVLLYASMNVAHAGLAWPAGAWSDRAGRTSAIALGWGLHAAVLVGFALVPRSSAWGAWPLMVAYGASMALTEGVGRAMLVDAAPTSRRATVMGRFYAVTGVAGLGANLLTGVVWDRSGSSVAFLLGAAFAVLALLTLPLVGHRRAAHREVVG